jgi:hypothetical protein
LLLIIIKEIFQAIIKILENLYILIFKHLMIYFLALNIIQTRYI